MIHVDDLADLLLALAEPLAPTGRTIEPDDGAPNGFTHVEFASMLGKAVGTTPRTSYALNAFLVNSIFLRSPISFCNYLKT